MPQKKLSTDAKKRHRLTRRAITTRDLTKGKAAAYKVNHARIMLLDTSSWGGWKDETISFKYQCRHH